MKNILTIIAIAFIFSIEANAQHTKIIVSEDAFIQGGETADTALGETLPNNLRIFNSEADSKYARITYLKFKTPKKLKNIDKATLNMPLRVYPNANLPGETFNLEIYAVENDKWYESTITWSDALELGELVATIEVPQCLDNKNTKLSVSLDAKILSEYFNGKKDRKLTLALLNSNFNKISAAAPSKDKSIKSAAYLEIE